MRKLLLPALVLFMVSCDNKDNATTKTDSTDSLSTEKMDYAYTIKNPDQWEPGSKTNTINVLKSLKAYEMGNVDECVSYFADSVTLKLDDMDSKISNDSLKAFFKQGRAMSKSIKVDMHDWESVKSKVNSDEYVSLWYTQIWEDMKGKTDSLSVMNDLKMANGKIIELDEKTRKFPKKKS